MSTRSYFVPKAVARSAVPRARDPQTDSAILAASGGQVSRYHLPVLASSGWAAGAAWAGQVLDREAAAADRKANALLAAAGYDDETNYYGVLDSSYPDHELIVSVAREGADGLERWDGLDWGTAEVSPDGLEFVVLDRDVLVDVLSAIDAGSAGVLLRPFEPKAWIRDPSVTDYPILNAGNPHVETGVMVAFYPAYEVAERLAVPGGEPMEEIHLTLAYLGDIEEKPIDYRSLQAAVARWARRMGPVTGEISGTGLFTAGKKPVTYASVDCPDLPQAREMLVRTLSAAGVEINREHGYTPHMTLAYDDLDVDVPNLPLVFDRVVVRYGDDAQVYQLGEAVTAAAGAGPDIIYAVVDEFDTAAVLDIVRVVPGPIAYRRSGGKWIKDQNMLIRLMGVDPPPVVEVRPEQTDAVIAQVDAYDAEHPDEPVTAAAWDEDKYKRDGGKFASKEGSSGGGLEPEPDQPVDPERDRRRAERARRDREFDIAFAKEGLGESRRREVADRQLAGMADRIARAGLDPRAVDAVMARKAAEEKVRRSQFDRARRTKAEQERIRRMTARAAEADAEETGVVAASAMPAKLQRHWTSGKGAATIRWGTGGDFNRCRRALSKYLRPGQVSGACANLHRLATGKWPGAGRDH